MNPESPLPASARPRPAASLPPATPPRGACRPVRVPALPHVLILAALLAGCAAQPDSTGPAEGEGAVRPAQVDDTPPGPPVLGVWKEPRFRRALQESYLPVSDLEPSVTSEARLAMQEILQRIARGELEEATRAIETHRGPAASAVFDYTLGNIHFQEERLGSAVAAYEIAVDKHPKFRRAWANLGKIHVRRKDYKKAVEALGRVIELGGGDGLTYGLLGFAYAQVGRPVSAESCYRQAVILDPDTMDWKMGLARSFFEQQRYGDAVALLGSLIEVHPERADFWKLQAQAYIGLEQPLEAAENYEMLEEMGAADFQTLAMLGDIYVNEQLDELAVDAYARAMALGEAGAPDRPIRAARILVRRGAYEATEQLVEAIRTHRGAQLEKPQQERLLKVRARIAAARGAKEAQAQILEEIVALDPMDGEALLLLGQYHAEADRTEKAMFYYERAAGIDASAANAKVRHAQLLVKERRYEEALPLLRQAQQIRHRENVQTFLEQVERLARKS